MIKEPSKTPAKECPFCHGTILAKARMCTHCWKDLETGAPAVLDADGKPYRPAADDGAKGMSAQAQPDPALKLDPQARNRLPAETEMKPCIHCGNPMPESILLCPACRHIQDAAIVAQKTGKRGHRWRLVPRAVAAAVVLFFLAALGVLAYQNWQALHAWVKSVQSRVTALASAHRQGAVTPGIAPQKALSDSQPDESAPSSGLPAASSAGAGHPTIQPGGSPGVTGGRRDGEVTVTCPLCGGEGSLLEPGSKRWTYKCPLCFGAGKHMVHISPGKGICAHCQGMGRIAKLDDFKKTKRPYVAERCRFCGGQGVL